MTHFELDATDVESVLADIAADPLDLVLREHAIWLRQEGREGKRAHLRGADLSGRSLSGVMLVEANLRGADLSGADLRGADLRGADLSEAILRKADLTDTALAGANLTRADLAGADFSRADATGANFSAASLVQATLNALKAPRSIWREADLTYATLSHAVLREANIRGAKLEAAGLQNTDLSDADARDADFSRARFDRTVLTGAQFRGADLSDIELGVTDLSSAIDIDPYHQSAAMLRAFQLLENRYSALDRREAEIGSHGEAVRRKAQQAAADRAIAERIAAGFDATLGLVRGYSGWFLQASIVWFGLTAAFAGVTLWQLSDIDTTRWNWLEISIVSSLIGVVLALFVTTAFRAWQFQRALVQHAELCEKAWPQPEVIGIPPQENVLPPAAVVARELKEHTPSIRDAEPDKQQRDVALPAVLTSSTIEMEAEHFAPAGIEETLFQEMAIESALLPIAVMETVPIETVEAPAAEIAHVTAEAPQEEDHLVTATRRLFIRQKPGQPPAPASFVPPPLQNPAAEDLAGQGRRKLFVSSASATASAQA